MKKRELEEMVFGLAAGLQGQNSSLDGVGKWFAQGRRYGQVARNTILTAAREQQPARGETSVPEDDEIRWELWSRAGVSDGALMMEGARVCDLLERVQAGDSIYSVAYDFGVDVGFLRALVDSLPDDPAPGEQQTREQEPARGDELCNCGSFGAEIDRCPNCAPAQEPVEAERGEGWLDESLARAKESVMARPPSQRPRNFREDSHLYTRAEWRTRALRAEKARDEAIERAGGLKRSADELGARLRRATENANAAEQERDELREAIMRHKESFMPGPHPKRANRELWAVLSSPQTPPSPPLKDTMPHGGHSEQTWEMVAEIRKRLQDEGVALPAPRERAERFREAAEQTAVDYYAGRMRQAEHERDALRKAAQEAVAWLDKCRYANYERALSWVEKAAKELRTALKEEE